MAAPKSISCEPRLFVCLATVRKRGASHHIKLQDNTINYAGKQDASALGILVKQRAAASPCCCYVSCSGLIATSICSSPTP